MNNVLSFLNKYLKDETIIIGCSGGPDSMYLLSVIQKNYPDIKIICAHINHNIREESKDELLFVKEYCEQNKIIFESTVFTNTKTDEATLRRKRYQFFEELIKKYNASYLLTAHHGDDLIETILMRLSRGSSLKGYAGIELCTQKDNYKILRPLLYITKNEILDYLNNNKIKYVIDNSNEKDEYTRNRYRHHVLPFLKEENKDIHIKYLKYNNELLEYNNYVNNIVLKNIEKNYIDNIYDLKDYYDEDLLIKRKIIEKLLDYNYPDNLYLVNDTHVKNIMTMIETKSNSKVFLPNNLVIEKDYNKLCIKKNVIDEIKEYEYELNEELLINNDKLYITNEDDDNSNYCIKLNSEEIKLPIIVRSRKNGDKIRIKNLNGSKKVKDILIDEKISIEDRNKVIIVTDSHNNILWIPGIKKSQFDKSKEEKYDIIIKYIRNVK